MIELPAFVVQGEWALVEAKHRAQQLEEERVQQEPEPVSSPASHTRVFMCVG